MFTKNGQLVGQGPLERGPRFPACNERGELWEFGDDVGVTKLPKNRDDHHVADAEASLEPLLVAQRIRQLAKPRLQELDDLWPPLFGPFLAAIEDVDGEKLENDRLDAVQCRDHPGDAAHALIPVQREQALVLNGQVKQDGSAFEQLDLLVTVGGDLAERLLQEIFRRARIRRVEQADPIGPFDLLERPADAKVPHQAGREIGHPAERGDFGGCVGIDGHGSGVLHRGVDRCRAFLGRGRVHPHQLEMIAVRVGHAAAVHDPIVLLG